MAEDLGLETRLCIAWTTDRPFAKRPRVSPDFAFQNSDWCLHIALNEENEYYIRLKRKSLKNRFRTFNITTSIENVIGADGPFFAHTVTVSQTPVCIWRVPESKVSEKIPGLNDYGRFTVICTFYRVVAASSKLKDGEQHLPMMTSADVSLHSEYGLKSLSTDLFKILENDTFPDVKLRCEDRIFSVHKAVLAARSEVFAAMFRNKTVESETGIVNITDVEASVLDSFIKYVYSGKIPDLSEDTVSHLYMMSDKYAVQALKVECAKRMIDDLTEENCLTFLKLADAHGDFHFKDGVISFVLNNNEVLQSERWLEFSQEVPKLAIEIYQKCFAKQIPKVTGVIAKPSSVRLVPSSVRYETILPM